MCHVFREIGLEMQVTASRKRKVRKALLERTRKCLSDPFKSSVLE